MPASWWYVLWQCSPHKPGLSAIRTARIFWFGKTITVSLRAPGRAPEELPQVLTPSMLIDRAQAVQR